MRYKSIAKGCLWIAIAKGAHAWGSAMGCEDGTIGAGPVPWILGAAVALWAAMAWRLMRLKKRARDEAGTATPGYATGR